MPKNSVSDPLNLSTSQPLSLPASQLLNLSASQPLSKMAAFRAHVTTGLTVGYILGAVVGFNRGVILATTPVLMCVAAFVGSFLPDVDSDSGRPFEIVFTLFAFVGGGIAFWACLQQPLMSPVLLFIIPPATAFSIRYGVGEVFQRYTRHRGIFHSVPAVLIATFLVPVVLQMFRLPDRDVAALAISVGVGYFSHLILDEIYATVNFEGKRFRPKKSLGTALSLTSSSKMVTLVTYLVLIVLMLFNAPLLQQIFG